MAPAVHCRDNFWRWLNQKDAVRRIVMVKPGAAALVRALVVFKLRLARRARRRLDEFDAGLGAAGRRAPPPSSRTPQHEYAGAFFFVGCYGAALVS